MPGEHRRGRQVGMGPALISVPRSYYCMMKCMYMLCFILWCNNIYIMPSVLTQNDNESNASYKQGAAGASMACQRVCMAL